MKTNQKLMLLLSLVFSITACKKESSNPSPEMNAVSQQSIAATNQSASTVNPTDFVNVIDNPYFPLEPGTTRKYVEKINENGTTTITNTTVVVTHKTKIILGVTCAVIHDQVTEKGKVIEDTYDWYAQDKHDNVWYFGEATRALTDTGWSTLGSWEAGVDGAKAGIIMYGHTGTHIGETYYQEFYKGYAEDQATLLSNKSTVTIALGTFTHCVETKEFTRLSPGDVTKKFYAPGLGEILAVELPRGTAREQLVSFERNRYAN
jgi:hypothetical protein